MEHICSTIDFGIVSFTLWDQLLFSISKVFYALEQVYDVTKFLEDHPGGDEVLLSATGIRPLRCDQIYC